MFGAVASSQITSSNPVSSFAIGPQPQVFGYLESHLDARNADEPREQPETLRRGPSRRVPTAASFAIDLERSFQAFGLGALAATLSPRLKTASVQTRPKPLDAPVINQTFC
jgi:hypothetical protein